MATNDSSQAQSQLQSQPQPSHTRLPCQSQHQLRQQRYLRFPSRPFPTSSTTDETKPLFSPNPSEATDFLTSDSLTNRFKNFYRMATGSMSPAGAAAYWADADARYSELDCKRCSSQRDYLLQYSPVIRYLNENISRLGGRLDNTNIRCRTCTTGQLGGFDKAYGIMLCANYIDKRSMLEDVLAHEMVHAYDHLRFTTELGADEDLRKVACSEIRASNLSGECRWSNEFFRNKVFSFTGHHQDCVRRRAVASVRMRPNCESDVQAVKVVNGVWDSCFQDTRPFDEIYR